MQRIMIIGRPGSGKSTFAYHLHKQLNLPLFHLDKYFFSENWRERNYQEFLALQQDMIEKPSWIIDGNSTKSYEMRYARATLCLYFNFPRRLCYWRALKRLWNKNKAIDDRAEGCSETIRWSLLKYMWGFETRVAPILEQLQAKYKHVQFLEIRSDTELNELAGEYLFIENI